MGKYILVQNKKQILEDKSFFSINEAYDFAKENLSEEDYEDVLVYTKKELLEELKEEMFMIVDWANNKMFNGITFFTADDASEYLDGKVEEDELEDFYIVQVKEYNKKSYAA